MTQNSSQTPNDADKAEIERLQNRVRKLAEEKSYQQLILRLIEQINPTPGLHDMVGAMLHNIVETIGGTNIKIWYWMEEEIFFADFLGARCTVSAIDDELASRVAQERCFLEQHGELQDSLLQGGVLPGSWTWVFPLMVGDELVGIIKLENVHIIGASLRNYLPIFFSHAALILSNEIRNHARTKAQAALRLAASVFANSQEGIVITDANNRVLDVNDAFCSITGYPREEILGQDPKLLKSGRQDAAFYASMWHTVQEQGSWRGEIWNRRKSGEVYAEMLSIDAVCDDQGQVQHYVGAFSDISQIKEHQAELERIAHYDTLTGLPNRRLLADRLHQALARSWRNGLPLAVCYLDLDGFKPINDQFGHDAGDQLLVEISQQLQEISRSGDTVARLGGDEFVLLFCDIPNEQEFLHALERVLTTIAKPMFIKQQSVNVSASIGVTLFPRDDGDADTLLRHADQAMYQAKEAGKGRYQLFDAEQNLLAKANRNTLQHLELALQQQEFELYYQPKVNMANGHVIGVEALIRWQHPTRGLLAPVHFLHLLTGSDQEVAVGEWVIDSALTQLEAWHQAGLKLGMSVNVGANQLLRSDFTERLAAILARHPGVPPGDLELEILESTAIDDLSNASRTLAACSALGVKLALDDFGTGYSSLTYFRKLPVGMLKIDQGFVRGMLDDPEDLSIIESVIGLARAFNRPVIAEGVETLEHGAMLVLLGCPLGQGYGIARPMPAGQFPDWIRQWQANEHWQVQSNPSLPPEDLAILVARRSLEKWSEQLTAYILKPTEGNPPELQQQLSPFGRWYCGSGINRYGHLVEFTQLAAPHRVLHELANEMVEHCVRHQAGTAQARLPELAPLIEQLLAGLDDLGERVQLQSIL